MYRLTITPASVSSLLTQPEEECSPRSKLVFHENYDVGFFIGMLLIIAAGVLLSQPKMPNLGVRGGNPVRPFHACAEPIDNSLTCRISASNAVQIADAQEFGGDGVNLFLGISLGFSFELVASLPAVVVVLLRPTKSPRAVRSYSAQSGDCPYEACLKRPAPAARADLDRAHEEIPSL